VTCSGCVVHPLAMRHAGPPARLARRAGPRAAPAHGKRQLVRAVDARPRTSAPPAPAAATTSPRATRSRRHDLLNDRAVLRSRMFARIKTPSAVPRTVPRAPGFDGSSVRWSSRSDIVDGGHAPLRHERPTPSAQPRRGQSMPAQQLAVPISALPAALA
jgi:hypothetical protein